ncbi:hypothetical protein KDA_39680 [Dictyobacter alpinus]|uniref:Amino acid permease n=1 Tax=Dictyobacter alpinus TaxID=2014873 RepID=A0A402BAW6_9CHLR|nr:APC family permease [Dictyobacter alpinus]GCE28484.1 hypothetical protein KDA_39680 [Dictyobacter alpinus]
MAQATSSQTSDHGKASLGPLLCWAVVFADIGSSIYYVPGILYSSVGQLAGFFVLLTMIVFVLLTLKYAEVSSRFPEGGGVVSVAAQGIHGWAGALGGMFILVSYFLTAAISCQSAIQYLSVVFPGLLPYTLYIAIGVLVLLGVLNWIGISESAKVSMVAALVAFGSSLAVLVVVFIHVPLPQIGALFRDAFSTSNLTPTSILIGFAGSFLAFSGLESISQLAPVMKAPRKKVISLALLLVVLSIGLTSPLLTALSTLLQPNAAGDEVLSTQLISLLGGHWGSSIIQQEVAISASLILIFAGNTAIIGAYHVFMALARMDFLPTIVLKRNRIRNSPHYSIALATGIPIAVLLVVRGQINTLGDMYAFGLLAAFSLTCLGLDVIRTRERRARKLPTAVKPPKPKSALATLGEHLDFWAGIFTTLTVLLAWVVSIISKPQGTIFGGSVVLLGMSIAIVNSIRQGRAIVLPRPLENRMPNAILAVLVGNEHNNERVIESALKEAADDGEPGRSLIFLYLSKQKVNRVPSPFEIVDPYLEDGQAKDTFRLAQRLAGHKGVTSHFMYQLATKDVLEQVWKFAQPRDVVLPADLLAQVEDINPDRMRYELTPHGKVIHLVKNWSA